MHVFDVIYQPYIRCVGIKSDCALKSSGLGCSKLTTSLVYISLKISNPNI